MISPPTVPSVQTEIRIFRWCFNGNGFWHKDGWRGALPILVFLGLPKIRSNLASCFRKSNASSASRLAYCRGCKKRYWFMPMAIARFCVVDSLFQVDPVAPLRMFASSHEHRVIMPHNKLIWETHLERARLTDYLGIIIASVGLDLCSRSW